MSPQRDHYLSCIIGEVLILSDVGQLLTQNCPGFYSRSYGYHKFSYLEYCRRPLHKGLFTLIYVRDKRRKPQVSDSKKNT